jgi:lipid-binding SYLF domain-containing protein
MRGLAKTATFLGGLAIVLALAGRAAARSDEETVQAAADVLGELLDLRVKEIPASLLADAHGVAIFPNVIKLGFVIGGQRGKGVVMIREADGSWRAPLFVTLTGGSIGWQAGAQASDIVLVFKTQKSVEGLMRGKFTLGADAAVAAGPVGRRAAAATDENLKAEIYSYSRSRGLFAGVSIDGSVLDVNEGSNADYYGQPGAPLPESAMKLVSQVAKITANPDAAVGLAPQAAAGPDLTPLPSSAEPARPSADADALRAELSRSFAALNPLLDDAWRRYLALPAEVHQMGRHPAPQAVEPCLKRYATIATSREYRTLAERREFQATHGWLQAYYEALAASSTPKLALPPPPFSGQR